MIWQPDVEQSRAIHPELQIFEQWLERHKREFEFIFSAKPAIPA